jgi:hypothetical protein
MQMLQDFREGITWEKYFRTKIFVLINKNLYLFRSRKSLICDINSKNSYLNTFNS